MITHVIYSKDYITDYGKVTANAEKWTPDSPYEFCVPIRDIDRTAYHMVDIEAELIDFLDDNDYTFQPRINRIQLIISDADAVHIMLRFGDKIDIRKI